MSNYLAMRSYATTATPGNPWMNSLPPAVAVYDAYDITFGPDGNLYVSSF